ncbi:MAG: type IV pilus biogenesis/stability protein PilW [Sandaracinaceae bacterium]
MLVCATGAARFQNGFVYDDVPVIVEGSLIHEPSRLVDAWTAHTMVASASDPGAVQSVDTYRPMPITTFALDATISGRQPWAFHSSNLLLHLVCSLLVMFLGITWLGTEHRPEAFYGAAVFAVHPWLVEAHGWINGRSDPLALMFGLLAVCALVGRERRPRRGMSALAAALFLLGLLSKETLITLVPAVLLMPVAHGQQVGWRERLSGRLPPLLLASGIYLAARAAVLGGAQTHRDAAMLHEASLRLPWLLLDGLRQMLVPTQPYLRSLRDEYALVPVWQSALALGVLVVLGLLALRHRREAPLAAPSLAWMLLPLVPIAILTTVLWPGFGRYLYLPAAGLAWALADGASRLRGRVRPAVRAALAVVHIAVLSALAVGFLQDFRDDETLYRAAILARPEIAVGHGWLGMSRSEARPRDAVLPLRMAVSLDPDTARYRLFLARSQLASGDREGSHQTALDGISRHAGSREAAAFHLAAVNALPRHDPRRAVGHLLGCLEAWPDRPDCVAALDSLLERDIAGEHCAHALALGRLPEFVRPRCE